MDTSLQALAEAIVRRGSEVRQNIAAAVAAATQRAHAVADGLAELTRATVAGAERAVEAALPADRESTLRQVIDGIGDGLATAAQAAELTLREAGGNTARYAREDLEHLAHAFRSVSRRFVDSVVAGAQRAGARAAAEAKALRDHAAVTLQRVEPSFAAAIGAAGRDPVGLGRQALAAGAAAARGAAGALFTAVGRKLESLGIALDPPSRPTT